MNRTMVTFGRVEKVSSEVKKKDHLFNDGTEVMFILHTKLNAFSRALPRVEPLKALELNGNPEAHMEPSLDSTV